MPSPIGHSLGALAVGWTTTGHAERRMMIRRSVWIAAIGVAPDLDLLIGRHGMETHSFGAALIVAAVATIWRWPVAASRARIFVTVAFAWATHPVLDALGTYNTPPFGVMMFWPLSSGHVDFVPVFDAISRRWWLPGFITGNLMAALREILILGPLAFVSWVTTRRLSRLSRE